MDIFTEPSDVAADTLANPGRLRGVVGTWRGRIAGDCAAPQPAAPFAIPHARQAKAGA